MGVRASLIFSTVLLCICSCFYHVHTHLPSHLPSLLPHLSPSPIQEEASSKRKTSQSSRSPSVCKTPELTSESSSEEASGEDRYNYCMVYVLICLYWYLMVEGQVSWRSLVPPPSSFPPPSSLPPPSLPPSPLPPSLTPSLPPPPLSDGSYSEGTAKPKKKSSSKLLYLTPKLSQLPSAAAAGGLQPGHPRPPHFPPHPSQNPAYYHQMMQYRMRYANMPHSQHMSPEMMYRLV